MDDRTIRISLLTHLSLLNERKHAAIPTDPER